MSCSMQRTRLLLPQKGSEGRGWGVSGGLALFWGAGFLCKDLIGRLQIQKGGLRMF